MNYVQQIHYSRVTKNAKELHTFLKAQGCTLKDKTDIGAPALKIGTRWHYATPTGEEVTVDLLRARGLFDEWFIVTDKDSIGVAVKLKFAGWDREAKP